jgi:hypothetical protein
LKSQSAGDWPRATQSAPSSAPSPGRRSLRELDSASCLLDCQAFRLVRTQFRLAASRACDCEATSQSDARLAHRRSPGDRERPVLEFELALVAGQHDVGGLIQERPHPPIPAFRDAADVVDLARLIAPWSQAEIAPISLDRRMREGSSIAATKASAASWPTPGIVISRRQASSSSSPASSRPGRAFRTARETG